MGRPRSCGPHGKACSLDCSSAQGVPGGSKAGREGPGGHPEQEPPSRSPRVGAPASGARPPARPRLQALLLRAHTWTDSPPTAPRAPRRFPVRKWRCCRGPDRQRAGGPAEPAPRPRRPGRCAAGEPTSPAGLRHLLTGQARVLSSSLSGLQAKASRPVASQAWSGVLLGPHRGCRAGGGRKPSGPLLEPRPPSLGA